MVTVCARCGSEAPASATKAVARGWNRFEAISDDGETVYYLTVCSDCLAEAEHAGVWAHPSTERAT